jgi:hypothetical protein
MSLPPSEKDLLERHLNGDLDPAERAAFLAQVQQNPELRSALAQAAMDEALVSELVREKRVRVRFRRRLEWGALAAAALMLLALSLTLFLGGRSRVGLRVALLEGTGTRIRNGSSAPLERGLELMEGDLVHSRGPVILERIGLHLELSGDTELRAGPDIQLRKGVVRASGAVEIRSAEGTLRSEDALFHVGASDSGVRLEVERGRVEAVSQKGERLAVLAGEAALLGGPGGAQKIRFVGRTRVEDSIRRACRYLESRRLELFRGMEDGKRHDPAPRRTYAELAALALVGSGYPESHPLVEELLAKSLGRPLESVYTASLRAALVAQMDPAGRRDSLRECAQFLVDSQCKNGQWDYGRPLGVRGAPPEGVIRRRSDGPPNGDNSVTAYAVLGLLACRQAGVEIERDVLLRTRTWWIACQNPDGGWGYGEYGAVDQTGQNKLGLTSNSSYGSATASALASLSALGEMLGPEAAGEGALKRGLAWMGAKFEAGLNPEKAAGFSHVHWLLAAERAALLLGTERFGAHEWYAEGAEFLLAQQKPGGEWRLEQGPFMEREKEDLVDTSMAILFLLRR